MPEANETRFDHSAIGVAHNHMNGSAHCIECGGYCRITDPTQAAYTGLVRAIFESENYNGRMPYQVERFLRNHGIDVDGFRAAANKAAGAVT